MSATDLTVLIVVPTLLALTVGAVVLLTGWLDRHNDHGQKRG